MENQKVLNMRLPAKLYDELKEVAEKIMATIGFKGELRWDASKPDGTMKKLTDVTKLHNLGWHHKIEIDEGVRLLYDWYKKGICINHKEA